MPHRLLLTTFGSHGDLHPYLAIGRSLVARGHAVTVATHPHFAADVARAGLAFGSIGPDFVDLFSSGRADMHRYMDGPRGSERVVTELFVPFVERAFDETLPLARAHDALLTHPLAFGAVAAAEIAGRPWASAALAPLSMFSETDPSLYPGSESFAALRRFAPHPQRLLHALGRLSTARWIAPIRALRRRLGLADRAHPLFEGGFSPHLHLALFSPVFGPPQPDWPRPSLATGFPFYDGGAPAALTSAIEAFLAAGEPPVVFTLGSSAVHAAGAFYDDGLAAARALGRRALLLVGRDTGVRVPAGGDVHVAEWASYAALFPRAAAIVHQGGIGTTAEALRSGRPMLVVPYSHDQPDNAARAERLGLARVVPRPRWNAARAEAALRALLASPEAAASAARAGAAIRAERGAETAAAAIETLAATPR